MCPSRSTGTPSTPRPTLRSPQVEVLDDGDDELPLLYGEWGLVQLSNPTYTGTGGGLFGLGFFIIIDDD